MSESTVVKKRASQRFIACRNINPNVDGQQCGNDIWREKTSLWRDSASSHESNRDKLVLLNQKRLFKIMFSQARKMFSIWTEIDYELSYIIVSERNVWFLFQTWMEIKNVNWRARNEKLNYQQTFASLWVLGTKLKWLLKQFSLSDTLKWCQGSFDSLFLQLAFYLEANFVKRRIKNVSFRFHYSFI